MHGRADDHAGQVAVGNDGADGTQRVAEAGDDALRRIGQGAVEIEDHQLRAGRHELIVPDRPTTVVMWQAKPARARAITATRPRAPACWTSPSTSAPTSRRPGWWTGSPPGWPTSADTRARPTSAGTAAVAARHTRRIDEVALLAGAAEGFALLANLQPRLGRADRAVVHRARGRADRGRRAGSTRRPRPAVSPDRRRGARRSRLVVVGNPTNPTSVLHAREQILALRRPGRIVVVDEAFADAVPGEAESLAAESLPDVVVLRSLTKTWSLAGTARRLRAGSRGTARPHDGAAPALAAGHTATRGDRRMQ